MKAATTLSPVLWDVDTEDWKSPTPPGSPGPSGAKRNAVVLMHDIHPTSVAAVPQVLRTLTAEGSARMVSIAPAVS
ncbi:hypothetical protein [Streptomyces bluensis]|uniref:hypothetical protein n=1 Tax=Streptomyces bluensis TaxID=33897 RepID=UPI00331C6A3D